MASNRQYGPSGTPGSVPVAENTQANKVPVLPAQLAGDTTSEQIVQNPALTSTASPVALVVQIPSESALEQQPFEISCSGYITTGASLNVTAKLYAGTSTTPGDNTELGSSSTVAQDSKTAPFWIHAKLIYDSVSGLLMGTTDFMINNSFVAVTAVVNVVDDVDNTNNPVLSFCVSFTFSEAETTNLVNVRDLAINF